MRRGKILKKKIHPWKFIIVHEKQAGSIKKLRIACDERKCVKKFPFQFNIHTEHAMRNIAEDWRPIRKREKWKMDALPAFFLLAFPIFIDPIFSQYFFFRKKLML